MATAKLKKYPPKPKPNASLKVWENYENRCKKVDTDNKAKFDSVKKRADLIKRIETMISKSGVGVAPRKKKGAMTMKKASGWF
ncbi:MAG: hypothetical protein LBN95_13670 [Prevotellaceae bacterium]|jgi:hypothetical protein|nr:hypothetical protein [Prevotellaceae bacterium]